MDSAVDSSLKELHCVSQNEPELHTSIAYETPLTVLNAHINYLIKLNHLLSWFQREVREVNKRTNIIGISSLPLALVYSLRGSVIGEDSVVCERAGSFYVGHSVRWSRTLWNEIIWSELHVFSMNVVPNLL